MLELVVCSFAPNCSSLHLLPEFGHPVGLLRTRNGDQRRDSRGGADLRPRSHQLRLTFNLNSSISLLLSSESLLVTEGFFSLRVPGAILPEANLFPVPFACPASPLTSSLVWLSLVGSDRDCLSRIPKKVSVSNPQCPPSPQPPSSHLCRAGKQDYPPDVQT